MLCRSFTTALPQAALCLHAVMKIGLFKPLLPNPLKGAFAVACCLLPRFASPLSCGEGGGRGNKPKPPKAKEVVHRQAEHR